MLYFRCLNTTFAVFADADECQRPIAVCDSTTSSCNNSAGSYHCDCRTGYQPFNGELKCHSKNFRVWIPVRWLGVSKYVCVCVCARARVRVCACACACAVRVCVVGGMGRTSCTCVVNSWCNYSDVTIVVAVIIENGVSTTRHRKQFEMSTKKCYRNAISHEKRSKMWWSIFVNSSFINCHWMICH